MFRKLRPSEFFPPIGLGAALVLGSPFGHCQTSPQRSEGSTTKQVNVPPPVRPAVVELRPEPAPSDVVIRLMPAPPDLICAKVEAPRQGSLDDWTAPVAGAPFSAVSTTSFRQGGQIVHIFSMRLFRDSRGRTRSENVAIPNDATVGATSPHGVITIGDPVSGQIYILYPWLQAADVMPCQSGPVDVMHPPVALPTPSDPNVKVTSLGEKTIDGIPVVGTRLVHTELLGAPLEHTSATFTVERWFSPDLGVMILTSHRSSIDGDSTNGESTNKLEQIVREEPDGALFTIPPGYTQQRVMPAGYPAAG
jgi:hypothetical protein